MPSISKLGSTEVLPLEAFPSPRTTLNLLLPVHWSSIAPTIPSTSIGLPTLSLQQLRRAAMSTPRFWRQPLRYMHWASVERPAIFWSCVVGCIGPIMVVTVPPIRRYFGDGERPPIPMTYPSKCLFNVWKVQETSPCVRADSLPPALHSTSRPKKDSGRLRRLGSERGISETKHYTGVKTEFKVYFEGDGSETLSGRKFCCRLGHF